ncbi:hypothetical protein EZV62_014891 [Acer yangbiense]|uniref:Reverse transcriptase domain-containing protein n=1 Tax=Acer yangbiense TaxID=1000413 RepID=A0A5C7HTY9_9ROSI|nr:hypothetical protein EZV62_014891 [Acer yangbiense]
MLIDGPKVMPKSANEATQLQPVQVGLLLTLKKKTSRNWKRKARESNHLQIGEKISSPLQRMLEVGKLSKIVAKRQSLSLDGAKKGSATSKRKSPSKGRSKQKLPTVFAEYISSLHLDKGDQFCKRKVNFDLAEDIRELKKGDWNSKFFHARASTRKRKSNISRLFDSKGQILDTETGMARVVKEYFASLFHSSSLSPHNSSAATGPIKSKLSVDSREALSSVFTLEEIKSVVFSLSPTKAPGLDDFQAIFFHKFWGIIGKEVLSVCLWILNGEASIREFNHTHVVLIPKVTSPYVLRDFRPISLCSVIYKIVTKAIAARLQPCMPSIISPYQSTFVQDRQIFDNVLVAFETLHSLAKKKSSTGVR